VLIQQGTPTLRTLLRAEYGSDGPVIAGPGPDFLLVELVRQGHLVDRKEWRWKPSFSQRSVMIQQEVPAGLLSERPYSLIGVGTRDGSWASPSREKW